MQLEYCQILFSKIKCPYDFYCHSGGSSLNEIKSNYGLENIFPETVLMKRFFQIITLTLRSFSSILFHLFVVFFAVCCVKAMHMYNRTFGNHCFFLNQPKKAYN